MERFRNKKIGTDLLKNLPSEEIRKNFKKRLTSVQDENYYQIISEMRAIYIFNKILRLPILEINVKTFKNKDVDFLVKWQNEKIYCEVKGNQPIKNWQEGQVLDGVKEIINRAVNRSMNKFLENSCNILIIADENTIKIPVINNPLVYYNKIVESFLNLFENRKISTIILLGGQYYENLLDYSIFYNSNPQKSLPDGLKNILDQYKFNKNV